MLLRLLKYFPFCRKHFDVDVIFWKVVKTEMLNRAKCFRPRSKANLKRPNRTLYFTAKICCKNTVQSLMSSVL